MRAHRCRLVVVAIAVGANPACGGSDVAYPSERAGVRVVECRPAPPPPTMASELFGVEGVMYGTNLGGGLAQPKLRLTITDIAIETGTYDPATLRKVLMPRLPNLQSCYARDTATASANAKSLKLRFTILTSGVVSGLREIADGRISTPACVRSVLEGMHVGVAPRAGSVLASVTLRADKPTATPDKPLVGAAEPWTPFAIGDSPPSDYAGLVARASEAALRKRIGAIAACFKPTSPTGSLRLLLDLGEDGKLVGLRAGGLGDKAIEDCVRIAASAIEVASPTSSPSEIACDLARGDAEAWRVSPDAGYRIIVATKDKLVHGAQTLAAGQPSEPLDGDGTYLVVVEPDTSGTNLALALSWAHEATATLVALRDPKAKTQAPRYLGMGHTSATTAQDDDDIGMVPAVRLGTRTVTACIDRTTQAAKLAEPSLVSALLRNVALKCRAIECARSLVVSLDPDARAEDLVEVTGAARRAGFDRVLIGGDICGVTASAPPRRGDDDDDFEDEVLGD